MKTRWDLPAEAFAHHVPDTVVGSFFSLISFGFTQH